MTAVNNTLINDEMAALAFPPYVITMICFDGNVKVNFRFSVLSVH